MDHSIQSKVSHNGKVHMGFLCISETRTEQVQIFWGQEVLKS